jgi:tetratricopeptide (TPR) repeat protein
MFDDGSRPNPDIRIERVCGGATHLEAHTDSKGNFSFQLGQNTTLDTDAEDALMGGAFGNSNRQLGQPESSSGISGNRTNALWNCELRAAYPGYRSDTVELATRKSLDNPDLGTIILHRLVNVKGSTLSITSALAPKSAQKDYQKGLQIAAKGNFEDAEKHLLKATDAYPKYAVAWFALGATQQRLGKTDDARKSYAAAIAADNKYVSPYNQLALLSAQQGKWQEAADYSKQVIQLNPVEFPQAFWFNAIANYNLKKPDEAGKSAEQLVKLDTKHRYAEAENLLGELDLEKRNYADAATHLRAYLALRPNAPNAESVKQVLAKIDQANTEAKK